MYIVSLSLYRMVNTEFLAPNPRSLEVLGWKDAKKIKDRNQVWRLVTPTFLHASFMHLALNTISILVIGSGLENGLGCWKLSLLYFVSSFGGILFSCVVNPMGYSVGASTAIFGLIGYYVSIFEHFVIEIISYLYIDCISMHWMESSRRNKSNAKIYFDNLHSVDSFVQHLNWTHRSKCWQSWSSWWTIDWYYHGLRNCGRRWTQRA